jgi:hypothetical protein
MRGTDLETFFVIGTGNDNKSPLKVQAIVFGPGREPHIAAMILYQQVISDFIRLAIYLYG